jgi:hypothetical protein
MAILAVLGIPHRANTLSLPDEPIFLEVRDKARWELVAQCLGSSLLMMVCVCRWHTEVRSRACGSDGRHADPPRRCFQFGIAYMLGWITAVAVCLSLWKWSDSWLLAMLIGTCAFQAYIVFGRPVRRSVAAAWLLVWVLVGLMVAADVG